MQVFRVNHAVKFDDDEGFLPWDPLNVAADSASAAIEKASGHLIGQENSYEDEDGATQTMRLTAVELLSVDLVCDVDVP